MTQVNVHEAKTHLSKLLDQAIAGEEVVITRSGKPLVRLTSTNLYRTMYWHNSKVRPREEAGFARHARLPPGYRRRRTVIPHAPPHLYGWHARNYG
jgi:prevent-host-death family protein